LRVFVATHYTGEPTPAHSVARVLSERGAEVRLLQLPFHHGRVEACESQEWRGGKAVSSETGPPRPGSIWAQLALDLFRALRAFRGQGKADWYIGLDNLNASAGLMLRWMGVVDKVVYYVIDHTPRRFGNPLLNRLYAAFDAFCCRHADYVWALSERMAEAKRERGAGDDRLLVVPIGIDRDSVKPSPKTRPGSLVIVSYLAPEKGVQLALEAMPLILKRVKNASLTVIGGGPYAGELKAQAARLGLGAKVKFTGRVDSHAEALRMASTHRAGLAPYLADPANYAYWADPAKPKEYLAVGLPVVITRVPWIAEEIERRPMGLAIDYEKGQLVEACVRILGDARFYARCRREALKFMQKLDWNDVYEEAFARMGSPLSGRRPQRKTRV
jgi:glycosyltransferase involved in cell wall biosynthesis